MSVYSDLVNLRSMSLRSRLAVLEKGIVMFSLSEEAVADILERTRHEYFDFLPLEREYEREFVRDVRRRYA